MTYARAREILTHRDSPRSTLIVVVSTDNSIYSHSSFPSSSFRRSTCAKIERSCGTYRRRRPAFEVRGDLPLPPSAVRPPPPSTYCLASRITTYNKSVARLWKVSSEFGIGNRILLTWISEERESASQAALMSIACITSEPRLCVHLTILGVIFVSEARMMEASNLRLWRCRRRRVAQANVGVGIDDLGNKYISAFSRSWIRQHMSCQ